MKWKKYPPSIFKPQAECYYQKLIKEIGDERIYANITEYQFDGKKVWELDIQIPEEASITKKTANIISFHYDKLNFKKIEKDAIQIIKALTK